MPDRKRYTRSYLTELKSVTRLEDMLAQTEKVIPHIERGDREPGEDGAIIVLAEDNPVSYGRLVVQVKKLSEEFRDPPRERIELSGLYHYLAEDAPFLLIGVDLRDDVAYWEHINDAFFQEEVDMNQETTTVRFDPEKKIAYDTHDYVDEFREVLRDTREVYTADRVDDVKDAVEELQDSEYRKRAVRRLELELDEATRSLLRTRSIAYGPFDKLRGQLWFHDITNQAQDRTYRSITSLTPEDIEEYSDTQFERIIDSGLNLLEYLYEGQRR